MCETYGQVVSRIFNNNVMLMIKNTDILDESPNKLLKAL